MSQQAQDKQGFNMNEFHQPKQGDSDGLFSRASHVFLGLQP